jgi:hypothetical protein
MAAALGSPRYAQGASHADYNGHRISISWNSFRKYYVAGYTWSGWNVIARGSLASCLAAALRMHSRGALGSSVSVSLRADDREAIELCERTPELVPGSAEDRPWHTWRHTVAARCAPDSVNPGRSRTIFDWDLLQKAENEKDYHSLLKDKYGRMF